MMTRSDRVARILCTVLRVCTISDFTAIRGFIIRPVIEMLLNVNESEYVLNNIYIYLGGLRIYRMGTICGTMAGQLSRLISVEFVTLC